MSHKSLHSFAIQFGLLLTSVSLSLLGGCTDDTDLPADLDALTLGDELDAQILDSLDQPLGPITREIVADNLELEEQLNLLARVEIQADELLEIYEPQPGLILVVGAGAPTRPPKVDSRALQGLSVGEIWTSLTNDAPMPPALEQALLRTPDVAVDFGSPAPTTQLDVAPAPSASGGWCDTGFFSSGWSACETALSEPDMQVCLDNWFNGAFAQVGEGYWTTSTVCPGQGSVLMSLRTNGVLRGSWSVAQDTYRNVQVRDSDCLWLYECPTVRVDITQATDDRFHFRFVSDIE